MVKLPGPAPSNPSDATNKAYVDALVAGLCVSGKDYGAGIGASDDTPLIQAAIAAANGKIPVWLPSGTYNIDPSTGVLLNIAYTRLILSAGAILKVITNALTTYNIVNITSADCSVTGGTIQGDVTTHTGSTGEWGHGINVGGSAHRTVINSVTVKNCWGDGIYVGNGMPTDVRILHVLCDSNRRQGISIVGANRPQVIGGHFINTGALGSTSPAAGIDIEPNPSSGNNVLELEVNGAICTGNVGPGIQLTRATGQTTRGSVVGCITHQNGQSGILAVGSAGSLSVTVANCTSTNNSQDGFQAACLGMLISGGRATSNTGNGLNATAQVNAQNLESSFNGKNGVLLNTGSDNSILTGIISRSNCTGLATTYHEVDIVAPNISMVGSFVKPATSGNRAINGINLNGTALNAVFTGTRSNPGTGVAINALSDTIQAPNVSGAPSGRYVGINAQTGTTYTLTLADEGKLITCSNTGAITVTIPLNSAVALPVGATIDVSAINTGMVTIAATGGVTFNPTPSVTRARYSSLSLVKIATDTWLVVGDIA